MLCFVSKEAWARQGWMSIFPSLLKQGAIIRGLMQYTTGLITIPTQPNTIQDIPHDKDMATTPDESGYDEVDCRCVSEENQFGPLHSHLEYSLPSNQLQAEMSFNSQLNSSHMFTCGMHTCWS